MADDEGAAPPVPEPPLEVSPETIEKRRLSFGAAAAKYDAYRPSYPTEAVEWAIGSEPLRVLEIGAGTGLMTRLLLSLGHRVMAVEPDDEMRAQLAKTNHKRLKVLRGSAEDLPLSDASVDAIVAAQAFHWFKLPQALPEMHRVLASEGVLAVLWNRRNDYIDWVEEMSKIVQRHDARSGSRDTALDDLNPYFHDVESAVFDHAVHLTPESLVGLVDTYSYVRLSPAREEILGAIRSLASAHADLAGRDSFVLPTETVTYRVRRSPIEEPQPTPRTPSYGRGG